MARQTVSIYDIAQLAGVSTATVSNVLNGKGRISQKTRDHVLAIAKEQGYVPNFVAKSLRERRTHSIGIITPDVSNEFYSNIVLEVETGLHEAGYDSYICNSSNNAERELDYVHGLLQKQVDGFVLVGGSADFAEDELAANVPVVLIDRAASTVSPSPQHVTVGNDVPALVGSMVDTLALHGRRRIAFLMVTLRPDDAPGRERYGGYVDALAAQGLPLDERLVLKTPHREKSYLEAEHAIDELIASGVAFDGVACMGDRLALGVLQSLKKNGLVAGRDVLVMGMDNSLSSRITSPTISSVERHTQTMAEEGVRILLELLEGDDSEGDDAERDEPKDVVVPYEVVERETTLG